MPPDSASSDATVPLQESAGGNRIALIARSAIYNLLFYINITVLMLGGLPSVLMGRKAAMFMARTWARSSLWLLRVICGTKMEFRGVDLIPQDGVVIAAKHQSILETFALLLHVPDFAYVFKRELNWIPLFGWYLMAVEQIAINRSAGSSALAQVTKGIEAFLKERRAIFIFPEGTRRPVGAPPNYKYGITHVYETLGARVMPVALNTGVFWPRRSFLRKPGLAVIEFLPVIEPGLPADEFSVTLQRQIEEHTDALVAEAIRRDPALATATKAGDANV